jgi:uncharacterized membrane protein YoaK (UPF0700 family)
MILERGVLDIVGPERASVLAGLSGQSTPMASSYRFRDVLALLLAVTAGATDATAVLRLGHVFASVITGNLVLLGVGGTMRNGRLSLFAGCTLGAYALGVILAAPRRAENDEEGRPVWPASTTLALGAELALLIAFTVVWQIDGRAPARGAQLVMLGLCAAAMGVQSTSVRRLGAISTTYLTSTLVGLLEAVVVRRWAEPQTRSLGILLALTAGAAAAAALVSHARSWLPVAQLLPLVIVVLASMRLIGDAAT